MGKPTLDLNGVHVFKKAQGSQHFILAETHPAMRLGRGDDVLYIQNGGVYTAGGDAVKDADIPAWFKEELGKASPAALAACGYKAPAPAPVSKRVAAAKPAEARAE